MKSFRIILIPILFLIVAPGVIGQETTAKSSLISVDQIKEVLKENPNVLLLDVRTPEEYKQGHLPGAKNIDFQSDDFQEKIDKLPKDQPVYLYCRSGNRSAKATSLIREMGFPHTYDMEGGFLKWEKEQP